MQHILSILGYGKVNDGLINFFDMFDSEQNDIQTAFDNRTSIVNEISTGVHNTSAKSSIWFDHFRFKVMANVLLHVLLHSTASCCWIKYRWELLSAYLECG